MYKFIQLPAAWNAELSFAGTGIKSIHVYNSEALLLPLGPYSVNLLKGTDRPVIFIIDETPFF